MHNIPPNQPGANPFGPPSDAVADAITRFARSMALDEARVLEGAAMQVQGLTFRVIHYGGMDANGITLALEMGQLEDDQLRPEMLSHLLVQNFQRPSAIGGYFAMVPDVNAILFCTRLDLDKVEDGAVAIAEMISGITANLQSGFDTMSEALSKFTEAEAAL